MVRKQLSVHHKTKPLCVVSVGISLDFIGLGAEPGVLHRAELSLDCAAHVGEGSLNFLRHAGRVVLVGPQHTMFFFEQRVYLTVVLVEPVLVESGSKAKSFQGEKRKE